ncbi:MAG: ATP-binding protein, partial [Chitinophagaceae bacterium]
SYESMKLAAQVNDDYHVAISYHLAGKVFLKINNIDSANYCFNQGLKFAQKAQIKSQIAYNTLGLGDVNLAVKNYTAAIVLLQEALKIAKEAQVLEIQEQAVKGLVAAFKATNNIYLHNEFLQQHLQLKDSFYDVDKQKIITRTQIAYEVEKKQQKLLQQQTELKLQRIILYLLLGVAMVLIGLIYLLAQKQKALKHNNELLHHANEELTIQRVELVKQSEELKLNNQHRAKLFSIIAHDLRSPMANLGGIIEHMDILSKEDIAQLKQMITPTFKTIDGVLNNLLQWSSQQLSGAHTQTTQVNLNKLIDTNIKLLLLNAKAKNIEIEQHVDEDVVLFADEQQLGIVVRNLLSNAIKFTHDNGKIAINAKKDNQKVIIQIADNGVGMSKQQLDALFNPATHFSRYGTKQEKGVGLGLILTKEFVEKNQGTITASSIEGKGTIFELIFSGTSEKLNVNGENIV